MALTLSSHPNDALSLEGPTNFRLRQHRLELPSGHHVGIWQGGSGVPLVVFHGYAANGEVNLSWLNRLTEWFHVIVIDTPGHGKTDSLPFNKVANLDEYVKVFVDTIDYLGLEHYFLVGHSFGGRLVSEVAATRPHQTIAVVAIDAIIGQVWDDIVGSRNPIRQGRLVRDLIADTLNVRHMGWRRIVKLGRIAAGLLVEMVTRPDKRALVALAIMRSPNSAATLERLKYLGVPGVVLHGEADDGVPVEVGEDAALRAGWKFEPISNAGHTWLLQDPDSCREIFQVCLNPDGHLAAALAKTMAELNLEAGDTREEVQRRMSRPDAKLNGFRPSRQLRRRGHRPGVAKFQLKEPQAT